MGVIKEFKEFALKGNGLELAIGIIIGGGFGKIVLPTQPEELLTKIRDLLRNK